MIYYGLTDTGIVRSENQDTFRIKELSLTCVDSPALLCAVCDGMGGAAAGNLASEIASDSFIKYVERQIVAFDEDLSNPMNIPFEKLLRDGVRFANDAVLAAASETVAYKGMGTTLVGLLSVGELLYTVNIGDSRMYALYGERLTQLTHDHSFVQTLIDNGTLSRESAKHHPGKNIILRAIGAQEVAEADIRLVSPIPDALLLCSDGLSNMVRDDEIARVLRENEPKKACEILVDMANKNGGKDNITVLAVKLG